MSWKDILNQETAKYTLQKQIIENRIPSAILLHGIEGIGKDALAIQFAKTVNCLNPIITENSIEECGSCSSCSQFNSLIHPNIHFIFSLPTGKSADSKQDEPYANLSDEQLEKINKELAEKIKNPYYKISIPNASSIRINSIRSIKKKLSLSQEQEGRRIVIVFDADEMTPESANAFLKTLEEPPENTTFLLTTSRLDLILPTIKSRCQLLYCKPIEPHLIAEELVKKYNLEKNEALLIANFSQGSYAKALSFQNNNIKNLREEVIDLFKVSLKKRNYKVELIDKIESLLKDRDKNTIETALSFLLEWVRDAILLKMTNEKTELITNFDHLDRLKKFNELFGTKNLSEVIEIIEHSIALIRKNVQLQLILLSMFVRIRKVLL